MSVQVLNEIADACRRKLRLTRDEVTLSLGLRLATCDAMIVAAAPAAGCETLWSEDMQDGLRVEDRLTIRNPLAEGAPA